MEDNSKFGNTYNLKSIVSITKSVYDHLTKSEQKVADLVLESPEKFIYGSITDVAEDVHVGDTTVLRYCRKVGYKGYYAFRLALAQEQSNKNDNALNGESMESVKGNTFEDIVKRTIYSNVASINETLNLLDVSQMEKTVDIMLNARNIFFFGSGISGVTAMDAMFKFMRVGLNVCAYMDNHFQSMAASLMSKEDVAIAITFSGSTKDTINVMKTAKDMGASTVCITHHLRSPITKLADVVLLMASKEEPIEGGALETKINQLVIIDILYNCLHNKIATKINEANKKVSRSIIDKFY